MLSLTKGQRKANQKSSELSPHTSQNGHLRESPTIHTAEDVERRELPCTLDGNVNRYIHQTKSTNFLKKQKQKLNIEVPQDPEIPHLGVDMEQTKIWKDACSPMITATLGTIHKRDYYQQLYANKMDNVEEMDKFLEKYKDPYIFMFQIKSNGSPSHNK